MGFEAQGSILGGSWVVISRVVSRITTVITHIRGLIAPLITTHEPPSRVWGLGGLGLRVGGFGASGIRVWGLGVRVVGFGVQGNGGKV